MDEETKILAMTECLVLWDYLAKTGEPYKFIAISELHKNGKLASSGYGEFDCPLCFRLRKSTLDGDCGCGDCHWPGEKESYKAKCEQAGSPFNDWRFSHNTRQRKSAAKKVLELLLSIEF